MKVSVPAVGALKLNRNLPFERHAAPATKRFHDEPDTLLARPARLTDVTFFTRRPLLLADSADGRVKEIEGCVEPFFGFHFTAEAPVVLPRFQTINKTANRTNKAIQPSINLLVPQNQVFAPDVSRVRNP